MLSAVVCLLEKRIGLAAEAVGTELIARVLRRHMSESGISSETEYLNGLEKSRELWESLVEALVIPETWFFRNRQSFSFLSCFARSEWMEKPKEGVARVLSFPCATGEEPYSIAMTLLDAGIPPEQFRIDAFDISNRLLEKARAGIYGQESFRGSDLAFRERYFEALPDGFRLRSSVMEPVRFYKANILDAGVSREHGPFDAVFCRNLLIYLTPSAKRRVVRVLDRMLDKDGVIFVGHIEHEVFSEFGFERIRRPGVFACRKPQYTRKSRFRPREIEGGISSGRVSPPLAVGGPVLPLKGITADLPVLRLPSGSMTSFSDSAKALPTVPAIAEKLKGMDGQSQRRKAVDRVMVREPDPGPVECLAPASLFDSACELADKGLLQDAFNLCAEVLDKDALHIHARFLMGVICLALKDNRSAADCFSRVVYLDPGHGEALEYLAQIAEENGDSSSAAQFRRRARRIQARDDT